MSDHSHIPLKITRKNYTSYKKHYDDPDFMVHPDILISASYDPADLSTCYCFLVYDKLDDQHIKLLESTTKLTWLADIIHKEQKNRETHLIRNTRKGGTISVCGKSSYPNGEYENLFSLLDIRNTCNDCYKIFKAQHA